MCLDFINTLNWRGTPHPVEYLETYGDLVRWSHHTGLVTAPEAEALDHAARAHPKTARNVLERSRKLRETLYRILAAVSVGKPPAGPDLENFNSEFGPTMARSRIVRTETGFSWKTTDPRKGLNWVLHPLIRSAGELLVSDRLDRVKQCADSTCIWLFLDVSRNRSRRWCDMKNCGNRAKAGRFYQRKKQSLK